MKLSGFRNKRYGLFGIFSALALSTLLIVWVCAADPSWAQEQDYPNKTIKVIIPMGAGGGADLAARLISDAFSKTFKVPVVVENRSGAAGMLGSKFVLDSKPDGYTILSCADSSMISGPASSPNPLYSPLVDFLPLCPFGSYGSSFGVRTASPFKTLDDYVKAAKANPGKITMAHTTMGGVGQYAFEVWKKAAGVDIKFVILNDTGPTISATLGGHVDAMVISTVAFLPYVKSGEIRMLAVGDRPPGYSPTTFPSFAEQGYAKEEPYMKTYLGFYVSAKTPKPLYDKMVSAFQKVSTDPEVKKKLLDLGLTPNYIAPKEYLELLKDKTVVITKIVDELGLKVK